jgi:agmatinase
MNRFDQAAGHDSGWFGCQSQAGKLAIIEVPFDATSSHGRVAAQGPVAMRAASHQVELTLVDGRCPAADSIQARSLELSQFNAQASQAMDQLRAGNEPVDELAHQIDQLAAQVDSALRQSLEALWADDVKVVVLGGDHGAVFAGMNSAAQRFDEFGVLQIDAHADLRQAYEGVSASHASVMYRLRKEHPDLPLVQVGLRDLGTDERRKIAASETITAFYDEALAQQQFLGMPWAEQARAIIEALPARVWISLDIDGLDPSLCPHTGTPVPGGLSYYQACDLIDRVRASGRELVGADLCEVAGHPYDALVGARLLYRLLAGLV